MIAPLLLRHSRYNTIQPTIEEGELSAYSFTTNTTDYYYDCYVGLPVGHTQASAASLPVLFFFHGTGGVGSGLSDLLTRDGITPATEAGNGNLDEHNFVLICPALPSGDWPSSVADDFIISVLEDDSLKINLSKVFLTGLSLGGIFISSLVQKPLGDSRWVTELPDERPVTIAGVFPISGGSQSGQDTASATVTRGTLVKGWYGENDPNDYGKEKMQQDQSQMNAIEADFYELIEIAGGTHSVSTWGVVYGDHTPGSPNNMYELIETYEP